MREPDAARPCLIIAPFFPPSGLPPSHRARLFVRHLASCGWVPTVLTVDPRDREEPAEPALLATVPAGTRVVAVRAIPARFSRRFGVGDIALRALPALATRAIRLVREARGGIVLLIVPPWYLLWLAPILRVFTRVPVVVDYVDPWKPAGHGVKRWLSEWLARNTEEVCLRNVAGVFAVSAGILEDLRERFPAVRKLPMDSAGYGFEVSDQALVAKRDSLASAGRTMAGGHRASDVVRLVYIGVISDAQVPALEALLDAFVMLRQHDPDIAARLRLQLYGTTYAPPALARPRSAGLVADRGLADVVSENPCRIPYTEALNRAATAHANLVLGDLTTYYAASKLMPLLAAGRPILALLHAGSEPAAVLRRLGARGLVCYATPAAPSPKTAVSAITSTLAELSAGRIPPVTSDFATDASLRNRTAEHMTGALADVLAKVVSTSGMSR